MFPKAQTVAEPQGSCGGARSIGGDITVSDGRASKRRVRSASVRMVYFLAPQRPDDGRW